MKTPKTSKGKKTKALILERSIALIQEKGFSATTLQDLCKASGVANGTFYHYFSSTTDILRELILLEVEDLKALFEKLPDTSCEEKLKNVLEWVVHYYELKGREIVSSIYLNTLHLGNSTVDPYREYVEELLALIIKEGQDKGEFSSQFEPEFHVATIFSYILYMSMQWILIETETSLKDLTMDHLEKEISRMLVSG